MLIPADLSTTEYAVDDENYVVNFLNEDYQALITEGWEEAPSNMSSEDFIKINRQYV